MYIYVYINMLFILLIYYNIIILYTTWIVEKFDKKTSKTHF